MCSDVIGNLLYFLTSIGNSYATSHTFYHLKIVVIITKGNYCAQWEMVFLLKEELYPCEFGDFSIWYLDVSLLAAIDMKVAGELLIKEAEHLIDEGFFTH